MTDVKTSHREYPETAPEDKLEWGSTISIQQMPPTLQGTTEEERLAMKKRLVRKLDIRLMPMLVLIYIMNYLDRCFFLGLYGCWCADNSARNAIAAAKLSGITQELNLTSVEYQVYI